MEAKAYFLHSPNPSIAKKLLVESRSISVKRSKEGGMLGLTVKPGLAALTAWINSGCFIPFIKIQGTECCMRVG